MYDRPELEIINRLDDHRLKQINENRSRLLPILDTIITMGKQIIPFRGHRDDGNMLDEPENSCYGRRKFSCYFENVG